MNKRFLPLLALALLLGSCASLSVANGHPAWSCSSSYAGPLGGAIATLMTADPTGITAAVAIAVNLCQAEASLAAGPQATTTTSTTTTTQTAVTPAH